MERGLTDAEARDRVEVSQQFHEELGMRLSTWTSKAKKVLGCADEAEAEKIAREALRIFEGKAQRAHWGKARRDELVAALHAALAETEANKEGQWDALLRRAERIVGLAERKAAWEVGRALRRAQEQTIAGRIGRGSSTGRIAN